MNHIITSPLTKRLFDRNFFFKIPQNFFFRFCSITFQKINQNGMMCWKNKGNDWMYKNMLHYVLWSSCSRFEVCFLHRVDFGTYHNCYWYIFLFIHVQETNMHLCAINFYRRNFSKYFKYCGLRVWIYGLSLSEQ